uniref:Ig-like domain-containing protein n=1 Tax=Chelydra serpentina TaxID=8475 RepID=A0A8C3RU03_CHESE
VEFRSTGMSWCAPSLWSDREKTAMEGTSTTITCSYDRQRYIFNRKYWCHGGSRSSCDILGDTENFVKSEYKRRLLLLDNKRGDFLVTMHQLVEDDSGIYWCGIQRPYADIMTAVKLTVTEGKDSLYIVMSHEIHYTARMTPKQEQSFSVWLSTSIARGTLQLYRNIIIVCIPDQSPLVLCTVQIHRKRQSLP